MNLKHVNLVTTYICITIIMIEVIHVGYVNLSVMSGQDLVNSFNSKKINEQYYSSMEAIISTKININKSTVELYQNETTAVNISYLDLNDHFINNATIMLFSENISANKLNSLIDNNYNLNTTTKSQWIIYFANYFSLSLKPAHYLINISFTAEGYEAKSKEIILNILSHESVPPSIEISNLSENTNVTTLVDKVNMTLPLRIIVKDKYWIRNFSLYYNNEVVFTIAENCIFANWSGLFRNNTLLMYNYSLFLLNQHNNGFYNITLVSYNMAFEKATKSLEFRLSLPEVVIVNPTDYETVKKSFSLKWELKNVQMDYDHFEVLINGRSYVNTSSMSTKIVLPDIEHNVEENQIVYFIITVRVITHEGLYNFTEITVGYIANSETTKPPILINPLFYIIIGTVVILLISLPFLFIRFSMKQKAVKNMYSKASNKKIKEKVGTITNKKQEKTERERKEKKAKDYVKKLRKARK